MARSVTEIKKAMTDAFMADRTIRERYGLTGRDTWNEKFSSVSLENVLFFIVASCCHVMEVIFDKYKSDVEKKVSSAVVSSVPWYHKMALAFQYGDPLIFNDKTNRYEYAREDPAKRIVKYAAVRDMGTSVQILVSGEHNGRPSVLPDDVITVFKQYMNRVKIAGVILNINSRESDRVIIHAVITVDPLVMDGNGMLLRDGSKPVETAIENYLKNIIYGGTFNKTRLVDAIQSVEGVEDIELGTCSYKMDKASSWENIDGNNYAGMSGSYIADGLSNTLSYVVQY